MDTRQPHHKHYVNRVLSAIILTFAIVPQASAQLAGTPAASNQAQSSFEVASITPIDPSHQDKLQSLSSFGTPYFTAENFSLADLIKLAYDIDEQYLISHNKEIDSIRFDVKAKTAGDVPLTYDLLRPLLQKLLADRLHLIAHFEDKEVSGYALTVTPKGPTLKSAEKDSPKRYTFADSIQLQDVSMAFFTRILSRIVQRPVEDQTSIPGSYDFIVKYAPEGSTDSQFPDIFTSLKEQLGLQLTSKKVTVKVLVIDHVDNQPTEN